MQGLENLVFNLISHPLINVNTWLIIRENESNLISNATIMTDIGIMVQPDHCKGGCQPKDFTKMLISAIETKVLLSTAVRLWSLNCFYTPGTINEK